MKKLTPEEKFKILTDHVIPEKDFAWPYTTRANGKKCFSSREYLSNFEFLIFSIVNMGFYCKYCATVMSGYSDFKSENKSIKLGDFVVSARKNFINFSK